MYPIIFISEIDTGFKDHNVFHIYVLQKKNSSCSLFISSNQLYKNRFPLSHKYKDTSHEIELDVFKSHKIQVSFEQRKML